MVLFEKLLETEIAKLDPIQVNANISRKPKFGWGNSNELRKVIETYGEEHYPFVWSVPKEDSESTIDGLSQIECELNLCTLETKEELLNTTRLNPGYSYDKVLVPLWNAISRQFEVSGTIDIVEGTFRKQPFPNYQLGGQRETQEIWDVLKVKFTAQFNKEYVPCCQ